MAASFRNTARNALRPGYASVMARKAWRRMSPVEHSRAAAIDWAREHQLSLRSWCEALDPDLWKEARAFRDRLRARAETLRTETGIAVGGGARVEFLYFVTRLTRPEVVVETGVAHGYSSATFLEAMAANGRGRLYSSDFPYFRDDNPQRQIGILVPEEHRAQWTLLVAGDEKNLPKIIDMIDRIDLLHYDSDKSYAGRRFATRLLQPKLADDAVFLMDDIQDNVFFRDLTRRLNEPFNVLGQGNAFVGAFGLPTRADLAV